MAERYEIMGKLASGGVGVVYRARDTVMGRDVALKRLLPLEETHLNEASDSLLREAAALARFQHPNVVIIYALEEDEDGHYVVTELIEGETVKHVVEQFGPLQIEEFYSLVEQTLEPLIAAQELKLLHRDIKPANLMVSPLASGGFRLKILDFGLAKFSEAPSTQTLDQTGSFLGSIHYIAPEQIELGLIDQRTDLYSLGCVYYYVLSGKTPFSDTTAAKIMDRKLDGNAIPLSQRRPDLPAAVECWLMSLIERFPNDRPADAKAALESFLTARKAESGPPKETAVPVAKIIRENTTESTTPHQSKQKPRRRPAPLAAPQPEIFSTISSAEPRSPLPWIIGGVTILVIIIAIIANQ